MCNRLVVKHSSPHTCAENNVLKQHRFSQRSIHTYAACELLPLFPFRFKQGMATVLQRKEKKSFFFLFLSTKKDALSPLSFVRLLTSCCKPSCVGVFFLKIFLLFLFVAVGFYESKQPSTFHVLKRC